MKTIHFLVAVIVLASCLALPLAGDSDASATGPVYSEDGKTLISFPQGSGERCTVRDGTEAIGPEAFKGNEEVQFVEMPDSVTFIGESAFEGCISLIDPGMPDSVTTVSAHAFDGTSVRMERLPSSLEYVGEHAFSHCGHITSLELPGNVRVVEDFAFYYTGITHLVLNEGLREIGSHAFGGADCGFLEVPASVEKVGEMFVYVNAVRFNSSPEGLETALFESFYTGCDPVIRDATYTSGFAFEGGLVYAAADGSASVVSYIPEDVGTNTIASEVVIDGVSYPVHSIAGDSFRDSPFEYIHAKEDVDRGSVPESKLIKSLTVPETVRTIGPEAFSGAQLKGITIPESVKLIGDSAFLFCDRLVSADIGAKVIGQLAFDNCLSLEDVKVRGSVDSILGFAFRMCPLSEITLSDVNYGDNVFDMVSFDTLNIGEGVKDLSMLDLSEADGVKKITLDPLNRNFVLKDGVLFSADSKELLLYSSQAGNRYTVPEGTESIGYCAFFRADATEVFLPESLKSIDDMAFVGSKVDRITIPAGVTEIEGSPFFLMTVKAECDPGLIDWSQNFPADSVMSDGTFVYTERDGSAMITGLADMHPKDIVVPSSLTVNGKELPVMLGYFSLNGLQLDSLSFASEVRILDGVLQDSSVKTVRASSWMSPEFIDSLVSGCKVSTYESDSPEYTAKDGVLFSGKTLVRFPTETAGAYTVPEGTAMIGERAFAGSSLNHVTVPASVASAEYRAFTDMQNVVIEFLGSDTVLDRIVDHSDIGYRFVSPSYIEDLSGYPQGHMIRYSSVDAPDGFVLPEDTFAAYGDEAVPEIPTVENYITYALVGSDEWEPDTHYMGNHDIGVCFVFEYDASYTPENSVFFVVLPMIGMGIIVVAFLLGAKKQRE